MLHSDGRESLYWRIAWELHKKKAVYLHSFLHIVPTFFIALGISKVTMFHKLRRRTMPCSEVLQ